MIVLLSSLGFPLLMAPVLAIPAGGYFLNRAGWMSTQLSQSLFSLILLGLSASCYKLTLLPLARLLQRREQRILDIVTHEVE